VVLPGSISNGSFAPITRRYGIRSSGAYGCEYDISGFVGVFSAGWLRATEVLDPVHNSCQSTIANEKVRIHSDKSKIDMKAMWTNNMAKVSNYNKLVISYKQAKDC